MQRRLSSNTLGDYAIELQTTDRSNLHVACSVASDNDIFKTHFTGFPVGTRFQNFNGYYKFIPDNADTMYVDVSFYNHEQNIGWAHFEQTATVTSFTQFSVPITFINNLTPDTASINFGFNSKTLKGFPVMAIDKLSFDGFTAINETTAAVFDDNGIKVYPNPANDRMIMELNEAYSTESAIRLFDLNGKLTHEWKLSAGERITSINVSDLDAGFYLIHFTSGNKVFMKKIVVMK